MKNPNEEEIKEIIRDANLPQFPNLTETNEALKAKAQANIQHTWRQRGPFLICTSCEHEHSQWIGPSKKLTGFDEKGPIIEDTM